MNPPYDSGMHEKFLIKCIDISNKVISVQPANFLIGNKKNKELINKLQNTYYNINREKDASEAFYKVGAVIGGDTAIHFIDNTKDPKFVFDNKELNIENINSIRKYTGDSFIEKFNKIIEPLYENDNLVNHIKNYEKKEYSDDDDWCIKISRIRGHKGKIERSEESLYVKGMKTQQLQFEALEKAILSFISNLSEKEQNKIIKKINTRKVKMNF